MKIRPILLAASVLYLGLAACGDPLLTPAGPAFDGGVGFGGGHRSDSTTVTTTSGDSVAEDGTVTAQGGVGFGGGH